MAEDISIATEASSAWAIVVGIDLYSTTHQAMNLRGACNDAVLIYKFLRSSLKIPKSNIRLHLSRDPDIPLSEKDPPSLLPTFWEFLDSLDHIRREARPGDFVHIHFSGHGNREITLHEDKKSKTDQDERLCFVDNEMTDVMFGEKLDELAAPPYNLTLLVTLDCCFSGGMTRDGQYSAVRNKPSSQAIALHPRDYKTEPIMLSSSRDANLNKGWLYRDRAYNVIAACQPYEKSMEAPDPASENKIYGVLTSTLISQLKHLRDRRSFMTYNVFQGIVESALKGTFGQITQQKPMLIGPRNRLLFLSSVREDAPNVAIIRKVKSEVMFIDRGSVNGSNVGDIYTISDPGASLNQIRRSTEEEHHTPATRIPPLKIIITAVKEYESEAREYVEPGILPKGNHARLVKSGWLANLVQRSRVAEAQVVQRDGNRSNAVVRMVRNEWLSYNEPVAPWRLLFPGDKLSTLKPTCYIHVSPISIEVHDRNDKPYPNLPLLKFAQDQSTSTAEVTRRLMGLLQHLKVYDEVEAIRTPPRLHQTTVPFDLRVTPCECPPDEPSVLSSWEITVHNTQPGPLFVAVFNLTPLYGVKQLFPSDEGHMMPSVTGKPAHTIIDISVPDMLQRQYQSDPSFIMQDILRIFITTENTNLRHLELEDITEGWTPASRTGKARRLKDEIQASWWVKDKKIITKSKLSRT
ncbi:caspase domain-containing protein [Xylariaceae sp. FL1651]|nr:caspase domain-containing protein [Xylariaceae sp. FL1651]